MTYKVHVSNPPYGPKNDRNCVIDFLNDKGQSIASFPIRNGDIHCELVSDSLKGSTVKVMRRAALHKFMELEHPTTTRMTPDGMIDVCL